MVERGNRRARAVLTQFFCLDKIQAISVDFLNISIQNMLAKESFILFMLKWTGLL